MSPRLRHDLDTAGWHVVVVLAGFAGWALARHVGLLGDSRGAELVLVCGVALVTGMVGQARSRSRPERARRNAERSE